MLHQLHVAPSCNHSACRTPTCPHPTTSARMSHTDMPCQATRVDDRRMTEGLLQWRYGTHTKRRPTPKRPATSVASRRRPRTSRRRGPDHVIPDPHRHPQLPGEATVTYYGLPNTACTSRASGSWTICDGRVAVVASP